MVIIPVLDNDTDDDGPLTLKTVDEPPNGKAVIKSDGTIEYMPDDGFVGTDYFDYEACDHEGVCKEALVTVVVTAPANNVSFRPAIPANPRRLEGRIMSTRRRLGRNSSSRH